MKIDIHDPRITAFALGELQGRDAREMARAVHRDARIRQAVDEVRATSFLLLESLGGEDVSMLTPSQRKTVRRAGSGVVVAEIDHAKVAVWKRPLVAGLGMAAVVAVSLYVVTGPAKVTNSSDLADSVPAQGWPQVDTDHLGGSDGADIAPAASVSGAARLIAMASNPIQGKENDWVATGMGNEGKLWNVPLVSGSANWPWIQRYVDENKALPPQSSVRIEEMLNHFQYPSPSMLTTDALTADMEICSTPWNPNTLLLAVHVSPSSGGDLAGAKASLTIDSQRISQVRLLGYAHASQSESSMKMSAQPRKTAKPEGNYVIYELNVAKNVGGLSESEEPWATLTLGDDARLPVSRVVSWIHASSDLRFASVVAASGMLMAGNSSLGELDTEKLKSLATMLQVQDASDLASERHAALDWIQQVSVLLERQDINIQE